MPQHFSNDEFERLKTLLANCNLVILKADKDHSVEIYVSHMETILSELNKFEKS